MQGYKRPTIVANIAIMKDCEVRRTKLVKAFITSNGKVISQCRLGPTGLGGAGGLGSLGGIGGLASQLKSTIGEVSDTVEQQVGNNSRTVSAFLSGINGLPVYYISVLDNNGNSHEYLIDPADGKVIAYNIIQLSPESNVMHGSSGSNVMRGSSN